MVYRIAKAVCLVFIVVTGLYIIRVGLLAINNCNVLIDYVNN